MNFETAIRMHFCQPCCSHLAGNRLVQDIQIQFLVMTREKRRSKTFPSLHLCAGTGTAAAPASTMTRQGTGKAWTNVALGWEQWDGSQ